VKSGKLRGSELGLARNLLRRFDGNFDRKVFAKPVMNAFLLACIHNTLPPDIASSLIVFSYDIRITCQNRYNRVLPDSAAVIRIINDLTILHNVIITEINDVSHVMVTFTIGAPRLARMDVDPCGAGYPRAYCLP
jgi:hypothetical protein